LFDFFWLFPHFNWIFKSLTTASIMVKVYFSLKEANELIKKIRPEVERVSQLNEELTLIDNTKIEFDDDSMENFLLEIELNKNFHEKNLELYSLMGYLIRQGCVMRELEKMEIDFYSNFGGKEILFCWTPNEAGVNFWHEVGEDLTKRRPVSQIEDAYFEQLKKMK
jgi:hypothetical protein